VNKLKRFAVAVAATLSVAVPTAQAAISTDIIFIVDESGSMGSAQTNLANNIGLFASILSAGGVDARYGLVGYGNSSVVPRMLTNLTTAAALATAAQGLVITGGTESGYAGTAFALNGIDGQTSLFSFRPNAVKNLIIFTDEDNDFITNIGGRVGGDAATYSEIDALLTSNNALFNAVVSSGGACTTAASDPNNDCYIPLALAHGGAGFDLTLLQSSNAQVVQDFVTAFANAKLQETIDFCTQNPTLPECQGGGGQVPLPGTIALFGAGVLGWAASRRKKAVA
jgi:hypothetical protein